MAVTLRDIAKHLNLSHATVSFVLNERRDVAIPERTRQRVWDAARELGYRPNRAARALVMGRTQMLALWMPSPMQPFYGRVFQGFHSRFRDQGYETIFCQMRRDGTVTPPFDWPVDGIIAVDTFSATQELVLPLNLPMVFVGPHVDVRADHVKVDLTTGSVEAVMHLLETGRKRIAFLSTQRDLDNPGGRHAAYRKVVQSAGHTPELILLDDSRREAVCSTMVSYVQKHGHPDALFCQNDTIAVTAIRGLADCGLSVPKDVSIVGFNNSEDLAYMVPSLSTVDQPVEEMCRLAMEMLQTRIKDPNREIQSTILPTNLIVRESSTRG